MDGGAWMVAYNISTDPHGHETDSAWVIWNHYDTGLCQDHTSVGEFTARRQDFITALDHLTQYRALLLSLMLEESWTSCLKHGVSHEPFSLLILVEKNMVVLVSFQFHSISAFEVWTFGLVECTFLLGIPFGHSLGMYLSKCSLFGVLVFWATREPRQGLRREWRGPGNCGSVPSGLLRRSAVGFISSGAR